MEITYYEKRRPCVDGKSALPVNTDCCSLYVMALLNYSADDGLPTFRDEEPFGSRYIDEGDR
jgi:hypothetical protein